MFVPRIVNVKTCPYTGEVCGMDVGIGVALITGGLVTIGPVIKGVGLVEPVSHGLIVLSGLLLLSGVATTESSVASLECAACVGSGTE